MAKGFSYRHVEEAKKDKNSLVSKYVIYCASIDMDVGEAAEKIGISRQAFWALFTKQSNPSEKTANEIAKILK